MEQEAEKQRLVNEQNVLEQYLQHPVTVELLRDLDEGAESCVKTICEVPVHDIESFFKHFELVGHLRGLRRARTLIQTNLDEVKEQLKEIN